MKLAEIMIKIGLAIAAVVGVAFLVLKYMDSIKAWAEKICCCQIEDEASEELAEEAAAEETDAETAEAEEVAPEAPAEEVVVEEGTPVAEETDFED